MKARFVAIEENERKKKEKNQQPSSLASRKGGGTIRKKGVLVTGKKKGVPFHLLRFILLLQGG